jgi:alpha-D-ribose 1-methylphosphonate 5-triphosphate synthase subunit PhnL
MSSFGVAPTEPDLAASKLSGGNLQKLMLAREMDFPSALLVAENPTAGLDLTSTTIVRSKLRDHVFHGNAVEVEPTEVPVDPKLRERRQHLRVQDSFITDRSITSQVQHTYKPADYSNGALHSLHEFLVSIAP